MTCHSSASCSCLYSRIFSALSCDKLPSTWSIPPARDFVIVVVRVGVPSYSAYPDEDVTLSAAPHAFPIFYE